MHRGKVLGIVSAASVGLGGIIGAKWEHKRQKSSITNVNDTDSVTDDLSGGRYILPLPSVAAASAPVFSNLPAQQPSTTLVKPGPPTNRVSQIMKHGFPGLDNVRTFDNYVLSYDRRNRTAHWVFEHLTREHVTKVQDVQRESCNFFEDESVHPFFRATNGDYKGSGYDRGHLAAAGNHKHLQKAMQQTFVLSNMAPQVL